MSRNSPGPAVSGRTRRSFLRGIGATAAAAASVPAAFGGSAAAQFDVGDGFESEDVEIESFDGTTIAATLYVPDEEGPHPAIMMTHGWGGNRMTNIPLATRYASEGYAVLSYDSRGFGDSGGTVTINGPNEERDAQELITWLGERDEVRTDENGEPTVGMDGGSYGGGIQLRAAAADDRLDAIVPRITWHDQRKSHAPNGVLKWAWTSGLQQAGEAGGDIDPSVEEVLDPMYERREMTDEAAELYYERSPVNYLEGVETPTLIVHDWYDQLFTVDEAISNFQGLREGGVEASIVIGGSGGHHFDPPGGTETESAFIEDATMSWLDAHLKGDGDHGLEPVNYYDDVEDTYATAQEFPPADVNRYELDLPIHGVDRVRNRDGESEDDEPLTFDYRIRTRVELIGSPTVRATVVPTGEGTTRLMFALQRVRDGEASTVNDQVTPVAIDEPTRLELDLVTVQEVFERGDTLRLAVATSDEPLLDIAVPSEEGMFIDSDEGAGTAILGSHKRTAELEVPIRRRS